MSSRGIQLSEALDMIEYYSAELQRACCGTVDSERCNEARDNLRGVVEVLKLSRADMIILDEPAKISGMYITQPSSRKDRYELIRDLVCSGMKLPSLVENPWCGDSCDDEVLIDGHCRTRAYSERGMYSTPSIILCTYYGKGGHSPYMGAAERLGFRHIRDLRLI